MKKISFQLNQCQKDCLYYLIIPEILFLVSFVWKFAFIDNRDICLDEPFTIFHAQDSLINILKLPANNEPNPPLFMILLHLWMKMFGVGAYAVRSLPILFSSLTAVILYLTGKRFINFWSGLTASLLFIFSTYHFFFGADTRTYSMLSMATAGSLYFLLSIRENPNKKRYLLGLIISNLVLIYGHYFGWFIIFIQFIVSFLYANNRPFLKKIWLAIFLCILLYIPMFSILVKQFLISKESTWVTPPPGSEFIQQLKWFMNSGTNLKILFYLTGAGVIAALITGIKKKNTKKILLLLGWWIIPYSIMFLASCKVPMFTNRYILFNSIGFYLFIGVALNLLFAKIKFAGPILSLAIVFLMYYKMSTADFAPRRIKQATDFIHTKKDSTTAVIIYAHWADLGFIYHYDRDIFQSVDTYTEELGKNNIYRAWGVKDTKQFLNVKKPGKVIFYQNNTAAIDPENSLFHYIDSTYFRTDSVPFDGGLIVSIFTHPEETGQAKE
jgi:mannosyltransferase